MTVDQLLHNLQELKEKGALMGDSRVVVTGTYDDITHISTSLLPGREKVVVELSRHKEEEEL